MESEKYHIIRGKMINPIDFDHCDFFPDGALVFNENGIIEFVGEYQKIPNRYLKFIYDDYREKIILPGLIDCHTHIPQYDAIGLASEELLEWLEKYIFPLESKFKEKSYYSKIIDKFFNEALSYGTTTICAFSSSHFESTDYAFRLAEKYGIRAFIGKTMMDIGNAEDLLFSVDLNIEDALKLIEKWNNKSDGLLHYILSPRYAGSCSMELMKKTSEIAKKYNVLVQTHFAENINELKYVKQLYPIFDSYLEIYQDAGFLDCNTLFAHCIYFNDIELEKLAKSGCSIIHCPTSNIFLQSGFMPYFKFYDKNIKVGLGTDVAGGYSLSILNEAKSSIEVSIIVKILEKDRRILSPVNAIYLATLGGAKALGIDSFTGNLKKDKSADFIILKPKFEMNDGIPIEQILSKIIYLNSTEKVFATYIKGRKVWEKE